MGNEEIKIKQQDEFFRHYIKNPAIVNDRKDPRFLKMLELINSLQNKNIKIADISRELGDFLYLLKCNGYNNIKGFDLSRVVVDFCKKRGFDVNLTKEYLS